MRPIFLIFWGVSDSSGDKNVAEIIIIIQQRLQVGMDEITLFSQTETLKNDSRAKTKKIFDIMFVFRGTEIFYFRYISTVPKSHNN